MRLNTTFLIINITNPEKPTEAVEFTGPYLLLNEEVHPASLESYLGQLGIEAPGTYRILAIHLNDCTTFTAEVVVEAMRLNVTRALRLWLDSSP